MTATDSKRRDLHRPRCRRILFVNHVGTTGGGAEASLAELLLALDPQHCTPLLAVPGETPLARLCKAHGIDVVPLDLRRLRKIPAQLPATVFHLLRTVPKLTRGIRGKAIDLVHANSNTAQVYASFAARRAGVPLLWHCRDLVKLGVAGRFMAGRSACAVGISQCVTEHLRHYCSEPGKLRTVLNGIDTRRFCSSPPGGDGFRERFAIPRDTVVVGMVSHFVPWKNHDLFLRVAAEVCRQLENVHFVIVGGDLFDDSAVTQADIKGLAHRLGIANHITFTGLLCDIVPALDGMDILVHPAEREPFGRALVEAMCRCRPVVAVNACGPAEIIRDGVDGTLVAPQPSALAGALIELIRAPERRDHMGRAGRRRAQLEFDIERVADRFQAIYSDLSAGRPGNPHRP